MASDPDPSHSADSRHEARPPLSGTRSQMVQRLQIGLFGLASMVLLVGLANIIMNNARQNEAQVVVEAAPVETPPVIRAPARDPLADAGVLPDLPARPGENPAGPQGDAAPPQP